MDSVVENAFTIFTERGPVKFACNENQLYVHVPTKLPKYATGTTDPGVQPSAQQVHIQTVEENMKFYTPLNKLRRLAPY